jgi:tetratricopeptide (TPR) repeat protein
MSFDRPNYLERVLTSLMNQEGVAVDQDRVFLFQDGGVNKFSKRRHASQDAIAQCIDIFRTLVPSGILMPSYHNLGVALNFERAEKFVFEELSSDIAVFLEDDLELGPHYLKALSGMMRLTLDNNRVGYVSAYGNHQVALSEQIRRSSETTIMGHNWAFALTKRQWLLQKPLVDQYLEIVRDADYQNRDHNRIIDLFHSWNLGVPGTSQDIAKSHACILNNVAKLNTVACFGKYIGERGLHFNSKIYSEMGFGETAMINREVAEFTMPSEAQLDAFVSTARHSALVEAVKKRSAPESQPKNAEDAAMLVLANIKELTSKKLYAEALVLANKGWSDHADYVDQYGHPAFLKERFRIYLDMGDLTGALLIRQELENRLKPGDPCIHLLLGRYFLQENFYDRALNEGKLILQMEPNNTEARNWVKALAK